MYFARERKGHEGVKGSPIADYQGIMVHDHDKTFYKYGSGHQECLSHILRYLKDSIINEPGLEWNKRMRALMQEMIHYRNGLGLEDGPDPDTVKLYENRYRELLEVAKREYEYDPPSRFYLDGYNLYKRLDEYMDNHLLFMHDLRVPASNNLSERLLRIIKRKQRQSITFRSFDNLGYLCECIGVFESMRLQNKNLFESASSIFIG
jgi:hypothetical protein